MDSESCSNDAVNGPISAVKEALDAAEQSAYDMFKHFSEGLREDIRDVSISSRPASEIVSIYHSLFKKSPLFSNFGNYFHYPHKVKQ